MIVAIAAPCIPISSVKIKIGSSTIFSPAPIIILRIIYCGLPSARIIAVSAILHMENGSPNNRIPIYRAASSAMAGEAPNRRTRGRRKHSPPKTSKRPAPARSIHAQPSVRSAASCSLRPRQRLMFAAQPSPISRASAAATIVIGNATFVAATPSMPVACPMKIWSAML